MSVPSPLSFPADLTARVVDRWANLVAGDWVAPPLPTVTLLNQILQTAYLAGLETDEGRPVTFTLCCTPSTEPIRISATTALVDYIEFSKPREFTVPELRRLASAADVDASVIWLSFAAEADANVSIRGLANTGRGWAVARSAFSYNYDPLPHALLVRVVGPGRMEIYQGAFCVATLAGGILRDRRRPSMAWLDLVEVMPIFTAGHALVGKQIPTPKREHAQEWHGFEWIAYLNVILATVNAIQLGKHGGAVIFKHPSVDLFGTGAMVPKYKIAGEQGNLRAHFVAFMTARHQLGDLSWVKQHEPQEEVPDEKLRLMSLEMHAKERTLASAISFIGHLAGTDGALVLNSDLSVEGFGTEIVLEKTKPVQATEIDDSGETSEQKHFDSEQKGMRHRSAIRLCAMHPNIAVFVVSQDGGISIVWSRDGEVFLRQGINTTNVNMVIA